VAQEPEDWIDRLVNRLGEWMDSLTERDETQNLGVWKESQSSQRQGEEKTSSN
jgi:hypothetical protein